MEQQNNFWGNARDTGLLIIAALTLTGAVEYYFYLQTMGVRPELSGIDTITILIVSIGVLTSYWVAIVAIASVLALILLLITWVFGESTFRHIESAVKKRWLQLTGVGLSFVALYFVAQHAGIAQAQTLRFGAVVSSADITFKQGRGTGYPAYLSAYDNIHRNAVIYESHDVIYVLSQAQQSTAGHPAAEIFEINRDDVAFIDTFIQ